MSKNFVGLGNCRKSTEFSSPPRLFYCRGKNMAAIYKQTFPSLHGAATQVSGARRQMWEGRTGTRQVTLHTFVFAIRIIIIIIIIIIKITIGIILTTTN